jgi:hypothetical protein
MSQQTTTRFECDRCGAIDIVQGDPSRDPGDRMITQVRVNVHFAGTQFRPFDGDLCTGCGLELEGALNRFFDVPSNVKTETQVTS